MNGKERMYRAITGQEVDRAPIWLREGFNYLDRFSNDSFSLGWQEEKIYKDLWEYVKDKIDYMAGWSAGNGFNRLVMVPPEHIHREKMVEDGDTRIYRGWIDVKGRRLEYLSKRIRGLNTGWAEKHLVESAKDLADLADIPFSISPEYKPGFRGNYDKVYEKVGDRAVMVMGLSSPIVVISGAMSLELFLELSVTEKELFNEILKEVTRRILTLLKFIFDENPPDTIVNIGGSEQCTPPIMNPYAYDEFVVPYDGQIISYLKSKGIPVNCHCHGKVAHALQCMIDMGIDSTDPVEPPPSGDVTYAQAREIAGDRLTLIGNLEFNELEHREPEYIRQRIKEILSYGKRRLILGASAGPISAITPRLAENYRVMVDTALEYGL